jgi:Cu-processing system permease protein
MVLAFLLSLAMLSVGFLVSAFTRRASVAVGIGLFLWLAFVFLGDLGMMGTSMALRVPIANLFAMSLTNPLQVFKMAAILDIRATLDILGPAGIYAFQRYGEGLLAIFLAVLALWTIVPAALAYARLAARGDF